MTWPKMPLSAITTKVGSGATPRGGKESYHETGVPLIRSQNVRFEGFDRDGLAFLDSRQARDLDGVIVQANDVLLNITGASIGRVTVAPEDLAGARVNQHVCIVRPQPNLLPRFLSHYLASPSVQAFIMAEQSGVTRQALTKAKILDFEVPVPTVDTQQGIVAAIESHFSRLDAATATLERVQRNLERYRASVLKAAVEGRLVPTEAELAKKEGRSYEPASVLLKRILAERRRRWEEAELAKLKAKGKPPTDDRWKAKYEEPATPETDGLRQLPDGWCWASVDQCFEILPGVGIPESVQGTAGRPIPIFKVGEISRAWQRGERFIHSSANTLDEAQALDLTRHLFPAETIVFAKIGAALALNRRAITATPSVIDNNCMGLACVSSDVSLLYAFHFLCTVRLGDLAKATTVPSVRKTEVARLPVPLPPRSEQVRIASQVDRVLSVADEARGTVKAGLVRSSRLRQSILKCAFEGRLVQAATEQGLRDFPRTGRR